MDIWLPTPLYNAFPLICVIVGFVAIALMRNPLGVMLASGMYVYSYRILWLRLPEDDDRKSSFDD